MLEVQQTARSVVDECVAYRVRRLNRQVTRIFNAALRSSPLSITEMNLLAPIATYPGVQPSALAESMAMDKSTLSRNLARLVERGYIRIDPQPDDRGDAVSLTDAGQNTFLAAIPAWRKAQAQVSTLLDDPVPVLDS